MPIYIDPTEARDDSRLPASIITSSHLLPGLEHTTGADILLTPLSSRLRDVTMGEAAPVRLALERHMAAGAVLVQRKSGGDLINSIPDLKHIQQRMMEWAHPGGCWMVATGIKQVGNDIVIGKRKYKDSAQSVRGALKWWQIRGGNVELLGSDDDLPIWVNSMLELVRRAAEEPNRGFARTNPVQRLSLEPENWVTTGRAFPTGIGRKKMEALAEWLDPTCKLPSSPPSLADALYAVTSGLAQSAHGWGSKLTEKTRQWWGIGDTRVIQEGLKFDRITFTFHSSDWPIEVDGDGVKVTQLKGGKVKVEFTHLTALRAVRDVLELIKGMT